jgi:hypothetical protein
MSDDLDKIQCDRCLEYFEEESMETTGVGERRRFYCDECGEKNDKDDALRIDWRVGYQGDVSLAKKYQKITPTHLMAIEMIEHFKISEPVGMGEHVLEYEPGDYMILSKHVKLDKIKYRATGIKKEVFERNWGEAV